MGADRTDAAAARYPTGPVLRATHRGALVVETENARRMMRRLMRLSDRRSASLASMEREESDQLPEEGPPEQVHDDEGGEVRPETEENEPADDEGRATGHRPQS
jgi:hypothetical protein